MPEDIKPTYPARREKTPEQALAALMRYASKAERSSGDAERLMRGWGVAETDRRKILARLCELRFIDDRRFAEAYVRDKVRLGGWGARKIRAGLLAKGISSAIVAEAMTGVEEAAGGDRLLEIFRRKEPSIKAGTPYERRAKLIRFGLSRGFGYEEVVAAAEKTIL